MWSAVEFYNRFIHTNPFHRNLHNNHMGYNLRIPVDNPHKAKMSNHFPTSVLLLCARVLDRIRTYTKRLLKALPLPLGYEDRRRFLGAYCYPFHSHIFRVALRINLALLFRSSVASSKSMM